MESLCRRCRLLLQHRSGSRFLKSGGAFAGFHKSSGRKLQYESRDLGDFYNDLISTPLPKVAQAKTEKQDLPEWVASGGRKDIEERARKLFGNIEGSGYQRQSDKPDATWRTINGVPIPPRPAEPDNCCMSGCVHCVWDDYRDDVESWANRLKEAQAKAHGTESVTKTPKIGFPRPEVQTASGSMDDDGGGSEALWQAPSAEADPDALFADIPIGIREFMATEKRIRERKRVKRPA